MGGGGGEEGGRRGGVYSHESWSAIPWGEFHCVTAQSVHMFIEKSYSVVVRCVSGHDVEEARGR